VIARIVTTPLTEDDLDDALKFVLDLETSARDKQILSERFGVPLIEGYGSSENAFVLKPVLDFGPGALDRASSRDDVAMVDPGTCRTGDQVMAALAIGLPLRASCPIPAGDWPQQDRHF
jgi:hypothetical protein